MSPHVMATLKDLIELDAEQKTAWERIKQAIGRMDPAARIFVAPGLLADIGAACATRAPAQFPGPRAVVRA
jgi:hypothetical protein